MKSIKIAPFILGMIFAAPAFAQYAPAVTPNVITAPAPVQANQLANQKLTLRSAGVLNTQNQYLALLNDLLIAAEGEGMQRDWFINDQLAYTLNSYAGSNNNDALVKATYDIGSKILVALNRGYIKPEQLGEKTLIVLSKFKSPLATLQASILTEIQNYGGRKITAQQLIEMFRPKNANYNRLLVMYKKISQEYKDGLISDREVPVKLLTIGPKGPYPKDKLNNANVAADYQASIVFARKRLELFGYKTQTQEFDINYKTYTNDLKLAIEELQDNNLLTQDGILGTNSFGLLATPIEQIITRLKINLDRSRWLPDDLKSEYVHVNLAAQRLFYYKNSTIALSFKTINGAKDRQTPILSSNITGFILNPTWTVAPTSYFKDKTKMFSKPSGYNEVIEKRYSFLLNNINVIKTIGNDGLEYPFRRVIRLYTNPIDKTIAVTPETWPAFMQLFRDEEARFLSIPNAKTGNVARALTIVQKPGGDQNALGWIKFPLNGTNSIYMHDTNQRELFANTDRLLSSGCVRMEKPWDLAIMLLGANRDPYTGEYVGARADPLTGLPYTITSLTDKTVNRYPIAERPDADLKLGRSVPVYMLYDTAQINDHGQMTLVKDYYGIDLDMYNLMMGIAPVATQLATTPDQGI